MKCWRATAFAVLLLSPVMSGAQHGADTSARFAPTPDGGRLRYVITGEGRDTLVVPLAAWLAQDFGPLSRERVVVFYDPRGRGGSSRPADSSAYGWQTDVADLEAIRHHLRLDRFSLLGSSYYGAIVALYAAQNPARVRRLVMVGPQRVWFDARYRHTPTARQKLDSVPIRALEDMRRAGLDGADPAGFCRADVLARIVPSLMGEPDLAVRMQADPCAFPNELPARVSNTLRHIDAANGRWDWRAQALRVSVPALVVHGADDPVSPMGAGREWARRMRNARLIGIIGAGHAPWLDGVPLFFDAVNDFLDGNWPLGSEAVRAPNPR